MKLILKVKLSSFSWLRALSSSSRLFVLAATVDKSFLRPSRVPLICWIWSLISVISARTSA